MVGATRGGVRPSRVRACRRRPRCRQRTSRHRTTIASPLSRWRCYHCNPETPWHIRPDVRVRAPPLPLDPTAIGYCRSQLRGAWYRRAALADSQPSPLPTARDRGGAGCCNANAQEPGCASMLGPAGGVGAALKMGRMRRGAAVSLGGSAWRDKGFGHATPVRSRRASPSLRP